MNRKLVLIFSDWHVHIFSQFNSDGHRLPTCLKVLKDIGKFCKKHGITTILFAGDLYDKQKALPTEVVNEVIEAFKIFFFNHSDIEIIAISGNHDQASINTIHKPAVTALKHLSSVFDNFKLIDNNSYNVTDDVTVWGIPYYEYEEDFKERLTEVSKKAIHNSENRNYLLIHQTPKGLGNDMIQTDTSPKDSEYAAFDYTFCGHIHIHKQITKNFMLVGNPNQKDASDEGQVKGFVVMNLNAPENGYKHIELKGYPKFITVEQGTEVDAGIDYIIEKPKEVSQSISIEATEESFDASESPVDLVTSYCEEVAPEDKELLSIGLSFLPANLIKDLTNE